MLAKAIYLSLILTLIVHIGYAQSRSTYHQTKKHNDGFGLQIGVHQSNFLNSRFSRLVQDDIISKRPGLQIGLTYCQYPLFIEGLYFSSNYSIDDYQWSYPEGTSVSHTGLEVSASLLLLPYTRYLQPFVGVGMQTASLGVGIGSPIFSMQEADRPEISQTGASSVIFTTGLLAMIGKSFGVRFTYKRSFASTSHMYQQLGLSAMVKMPSYK